MECDACGVEIREIAFFSEALKGSVLALSTYNKEMLEIVKVVRKWRPYFLGKQFVVKRDQRSLKYLLEQRITMPTQTRWLPKLLSYDYIIRYKKGKENGAKASINNVVRLNGMPTSIFSDRDNAFMSNLWKTIFQLQGTKLCISSSYHSHTDGQTEAEYSYNTAIHSTTKISPFEAVYVIPPPTLLSYVLGTTNVQAMDVFLRSRDIVLRDLPWNLTIARNRTNTQVDKHRPEVVFNVGEYVYLKLQPYC
ncbi:hypothetical protein QYF36_022827 [Acer negundo]|nr:hypothetical protein QYF36_022827 [Acer negundo]